MAENVQGRGSFHRNVRPRVPRRCTLYVVTGEDPNALSFRSAYALLLESQDSYDSVTLVASIIQLIAPGLKNAVIHALLNCGIEVEEIDENRVIEHTGLVEEELPLILETHANLIWACCILGLFKNHSEENYLRYMNARVLALKSQAPLPQDYPVKIPFSFKQAKDLRQMLGTQRPLCREVIDVVLANMFREVSIQNILLYINNFISWSELSAFKFIHDTLVLTESPVLKEKCIEGEVEKAFETLSAIAAHETPQLYYYYAPENELHLLNKNRFPNLIALAQKIHFTIYAPRPNHFVATSRGVDRELVDRLFANHVAAMGLPPL